ncbi:MAG TPA: AAA family ATPase [Candidatus Baltobacteraceae bacterium]|nr:AAA family ATPase [Candidatus Baltobacteraceae bacterium]
MGFVLAVTGAIGSGKTTLASRIAAVYDALHLSSDEVRLSLSHKQRRSGEKVFAELHRRFERALDEGRSVVLDSTGMSPRFRALLRAHRERIVHVHLLLSSPECFEEREAGRADRPAGALSRAAFFQSRTVEFHDAPDLVVATDGLTPQQVYQEAEGALAGRP